MGRVGIAEVSRDGPQGESEHPGMPLLPGSGRRLPRSEKSFWRCVSAFFRK
jgi:hypothetical protein